MQKGVVLAAVGVPTLFSREGLKYRLTWVVLSEEQISRGDSNFRVDTGVWRNHRWVFDAASLRLLLRIRAIFTTNAGLVHRKVAGRTN